MGDGGNGLKTQPMVYRWMGRAEWVRNTPTSNEAIRMRTVNHKPMNHPKTTPTPSRQEGGQLSVATVVITFIFIIYFVAMVPSL